MWSNIRRNVRLPCKTCRTHDPPCVTDGIETGPKLVSRILLAFQTLLCLSVFSPSLHSSQPPPQTIDSCPVYAPLSTAFPSPSDYLFYTRTIATTWRTQPRRHVYSCSVFISSLIVMEWLLTASFQLCSISSLFVDLRQFGKVAAWSSILNLSSF